MTTKRTFTKQRKPAVVAPTPAPVSDETTAFKAGSTIRNVAIGAVSTVADTAVAAVSSVGNGIIDFGKGLFNVHPSH